MKHPPTTSRRNGPIAALIVALCSITGLLPCRADAFPQDPGAVPSPPESPKSPGRPPRKSGGGPPPMEVVQKFEPHRIEAAKSLVRVRLSYSMETRFPNGDKGPSSEIEQGVFPGIVIDPLPLIALPDTTGDPSRFSPQLPGAAGSAPKPTGFVNGVALSGPFYDAILKSGKRVRLELSERTRPLSWMILKLADESDPPSELRNALELPVTRRRIGANESYVATLYRTPFESDAVISLPGWMAAGGENFYRPALSGMVAAMGAPVFSVDGDWLGVVNQPPEGEPLETPRLGHVDASSVTPAQDPKSWATGYRWPVLFSIDELAPEIERMRKTASAPRDFPELGLAIADVKGEVRVTSVAPSPGSPAPTGSTDTITPKPAVGDRVISLGGRPTNTVAGFMRALEGALTGDAKTAEIVFERDGESRVATVRFPG